MKKLVSLFYETWIIRNESNLIQKSVFAIKITHCNRNFIHLYQLEVLVSEKKICSL